MRSSIYGAIVFCPGAGPGPAFDWSPNPGKQLLKGRGCSTDAAHRAATAFREHDERTLARQRALRHDERALIQSVQEAAAELEELFELDEPETRRRDPGEMP